MSNGRTSSQPVSGVAGHHRKTCEGEHSPASTTTVAHSKLLACPGRAEGETPKPPPLEHDKDPLHLPGTVASQASSWCETTLPGRALGKSP